MELDLRYKQYELATNTAEKKEEVSETEIVVNKPFQEVIDFFDEGSNTMFSYKELMKVLKNLNGKQEIILSNGAKLLINGTSGLVNVGIIYPDKTKFVGCWSNITDDAEFMKTSFGMVEKSKE